MQQTYQSKIFSFFLDREGAVALSEELKKNQQAFIDAVALGEKIKKTCNEDDIEQLKSLINANMAIIPRIQLFLYEAFEQSVLYRYEEIIQYFLSNGYSIPDSDQKLLVNLVQTSRFLKQDPPIEILQILLEHGANIEEVESENYRTSLHLSCKYAIQPFIRLLIERGADVNAVDRKRRTPLEYLEKSMKNNPNLNSVYDLLKSKCSVLSYQEELSQKH